MAKRQSAGEKVIKIINGLADEAGVYLNYNELKQRVRGSWDYKTNLSKAISNLSQYGYLEVVEIENSKKVRVTKKGRFKFWRPYIKKEWDGRWRLVAFDIPETRKKNRDDLREALKRMGFRQMQKSLWICPYDVSEEIEEILEILDLENEVDYFIADAITNKDKFLDLFNLNQEK